jgi:HAD domain in Swiss Army Knife RNA repair proteins
VLNVYNRGRDEYGQIFDDRYVNNLKHLIDATGAKIVISSTWRTSGLDVMREIWRKRALPGEILDITPDSAYSVGKLWLGRSRGHEIKMWLDEHGDGDRYVILDDETDFLKEQLDNLVRCSKQNVSDSTHGDGLTASATKKAISILSN